MVRIVPFESRGTQVNKAVVELLREALADAEKGQLQAVALASIETGGTSRVDVSKNDCFHALLGAVALMHHRMCARHIGDDI